MEIWNSGMVKNFFRNGAEMVQFWCTVRVDGQAMPGERQNHAGQNHQGTSYFDF
jgi:hypothetical protein